MIETYIARLKEDVMMGASKVGMCLSPTCATSALPTLPSGVKVKLGIERQNRVLSSKSGL
jgi:hypothetical protein